MHKLLSTVLAAAVAAFLTVSPTLAQVEPDPGIPGLPGAADTADPPQNAENPRGKRWRVKFKSILKAQGLSVACAVGYEMVDAGLKASGEDPRELTSIEAIDNAATCWLAPAVVVKVGNWSAGIKDNACSYDVARRALKENNTPQAQQELLWRDGSWERRQGKFLSQYEVCYKNKPTNEKKVKGFRGRKLTS